MQDNIQKEGLLPVGTLLSNGKYRIESYLSSGGFGNTYVAIDTAFDERVAIKELFIKGVCGRNTSSTDISVSLSENQRAFAQQQEKFRKEARRLRKLVNAHIVKVHDLFDENGTSYYVMDYIDGVSLSKRVKDSKAPMTESELMLVLPQVLDALECVHNEGIWHLDLKPANIMLDRKGNAILIDFGASKQLRNSSGDSLSTSSAMAYTPGYASSEQMEQNIEKFGPWTDLYSLGATMFNLLTLQQPPSPSDIDEDSRVALKMPESISKKTRKLIFWLMKPNRKMRPQSVADVKQFLLEVKDSPAGNTTSPSDDDDPDTVLKKKGPQANGAQDKKPEKPSVKPSAKNGKETGKGLRIAAGVVGAVLIAAGCMYFYNGQRTADEIDWSDTPVDVIDTMVITNATDMAITVQSGPDNMRSYKFTGEIVDTIGALPNGKGIAKFAQYGDIPAATYEGNFVDGICEDTTGKATLTFANGEKYVGTFSGGFYSKGRYTLGDGSYFEGTFKDGNPYNGNWYTANGTPDGNVVNGVDSPVGGVQVQVKTNEPKKNSPKDPSPKDPSPNEIIDQTIKK